MVGGWGRQGFADPRMERHMKMNMEKEMKTGFM